MTAVVNEVLARSEFTGVNEISPNNVYWIEAQTDRQTDGVVCYLNQPLE